MDDVDDQKRFAGMEQRRVDAGVERVGGFPRGDGNRSEQHSTERGAASA